MKKFEPPEFLYDKQFIREQKSFSKTSNLDEKMEECKEIYKRKIDENLDIVSVWLNDCINAHEPQQEVMSNYCNYEIPEEHFGEVERTPDYLD